MPVQDIKIRYVADIQDVVNKVKKLKGELGSVNDSVKKNKKDTNDWLEGFRNAIPLAMIEMAIQKTGEWAQNLQRAADQTRTTTDQYQVLKALFARSHLDEGNIKHFFDKLNSSATEAVSGNADLISSFARLGIQMKDLKSMPTVNLFEKILGKGGDLSKQNIFLEKVFGKENIQDIQNLGMQFTGGKSNVGGTLAQYAGQGAGVPIVSHEDVSSMADSWTQFMLNLKDLGVALAPLGVLILNLVTGITKMLSGVVNTITGTIADFGTAFKQALHGDFIGAAKTFYGKGAGRTLGIGTGLVEAVTSIPDALIGTHMTKAIDDNKKLNAAFKMSGLNASEINAAKGAGEAATLLIGGGIGAGVKGAGMTLKGASLGGRIGGVARLGDKLMESDLGAMAMNGAIPIGKMGSAAGYIVRGAAQAGIATTIGATQKSGQFFHTQPGVSEVNRGAGVFGFGTLGTTAGAGAGNPNLRFGGVYGQDVQTRLMKLNEKMVDYLFQIVQNTGGRVGAAAPSAYHQYPTEMH